MEFRDLQYFAAIAEHGNIGRAAEALGLSQPALSTSLRRIEDLMQAKLVSRTPKGVALTPAGSALLEQVGRFRLSIEDVKRVVRDVAHGRTGEVRIGAGAAIAADLLATSYDRFSQEARFATLKIDMDVTAKLLPRVLSGDLDLMISIVSSPAPLGVVQEHLFDETMVVAAARGHPLGRRRKLTVPDLAGSRWALPGVEARSWHWMHRIFESAGVEAPTVAMIAPTSIRLPAVASSTLLTFCSRRTLCKHAHELAEVDVKALQWTRRIGVTSRKDAYLPPAAQRLVSVLKAAASGSLSHATKSPTNSLTAIDSKRF